MPEQTPIHFGRHDTDLIRHFPFTSQSSESDLRYAAPPLHPPQAGVAPVETAQPQTLAPESRAEAGTESRGRRRRREEVGSGWEKIVDAKEISGNDQRQRERERGRTTC